jgi:hypothetical protein
METLYIGEDKTIYFDLLDKDGEPLNFADLIDMVVILSINNIEVAKYSKVEAEGFEPVTAGETVTEAKIILTSDKTSDFNTGLLQMQIDLVIEDSDYVNGRKDREVADLFRVRKGVAS